MTPIVVKLQQTAEHQLEGIDRCQRARVPRYFKFFLSAGLMLFFLLLGAKRIADGAPGAARNLVAVQVVLAILLVSFFKLTSWLTRSSVQKSPFLNVHYTITFSDDGVESVSNSEQIHLDWPVFKQVIHFRDGFLLRSGPEKFDWIRGSDFVDPLEIPAFEELLRTHVTDHKIIEPYERAG